MVIIIWGSLCEFSRSLITQIGEKDIDPDCTFSRVCIDNYDDQLIV